MKKYFIITVIIFSVHFLSAQKHSIGITAGGTLSNMRSKVDGRSVTIDSKFGFTAGIIADIELATNLSFQPQLNFTQKGSKEKDEFNGDKETLTLNLNYLELPLNIIYKIPTGRNQFFIGGGPSISMGTGGKFIYKSSAHPEENDKNDVNFGNNEEEDDFKSFDGGINITGGVYINKKFMVALNYYQGFSNLFIKPVENESLRNRYFGLRFGFLLHSKPSPGK